MTCTIRTLLDCSPSDIAEGVVAIMWAIILIWVVYKILGDFE